MRRREGFSPFSLVDALTCGPIVVMALQTGMRRGEILGLRWEHIDFEQKTIYIAHTKTGKPRRIRMTKPVEVELRSLKQDASLDEHVFSYARTGLKLTTFRHAWEGACKQAKIAGLRFHDLRHTFATRLRAKGVHEMDIMSLLGHTTLQMTSRYTHAMPQNLRMAVDSLTCDLCPSVREARAKWRLERMELDGIESF